MKHGARSLEYSVVFVILWRTLPTLRSRLKLNCYLICSILFFYSLMYGQITIEQVDIPQIGFQAVMLEDTSSGIAVDVGKAGGPRVWDFTQDFQGRILHYSVIDPNKTPYFAYFSNADLAVVSQQYFRINIPGFFNIDTLVPMYIYNQITPNKINLLGKALTTSIFSGAFPLAEPSTGQPVPLTYGSSWQTVNNMETILDTVYFSIPVQAKITWIDTLDILVDAFGSLVIPSGNYNVLREKIYYKHYLRINISTNGFPLTTVDHHTDQLIYSWIAKGYGSILKVTSADTVLPFDENFTDANEVIRFHRLVTPSFYLTLKTDKISIYPGQSDSCYVTFVPVDQFEEPISLSILSSISGLLADFSPSVIDSNTYSVLTLISDPDITPGIYEITIQGTANGITDSDTLTIQVKDFPFVNIYPTADSVKIAGDKFWLDICIGDSTRPVNDLYGLSFVLHYDTSWLKIDSTLEKSTVLGSFFGDPSETIYFNTPQDSIKGDSLEFGISRIYPNTSVSGWGVVLRLKFRSKIDAPDTTVKFRITSAVGNDSLLNPIQIVPKDFYMKIRSLVTVWPGDTDNNGLVNQADLLPIGLCWGQQGYPRLDYPNIVWEAQLCRPWPQGVNVTCADANGDSVVDQNDILVIGFNWNKNRALAKNVYTQIANNYEKGFLKIKIIPDSVNGFVNVLCEVNDVKNLLGIGMKFLYPSNEIKITSVNIGDFLGKNPLFFQRDDNERGQLSIAISRVREQGGVSGSGCLIVIRMEIESNICLSQINLEHAVGIDEAGNQFDFNIEQYDFTSNISIDNKKIYSFILYQNYPNPFNTQTTFKYELPKMTHVIVRILDLLGEEVVTLVDENQQSSCYDVIWDGRNLQRRSVSSGIYYFELQTGEFRSVRKCLLMK